jgi:hypothetical protein
MLTQTLAVPTQLHDVIPPCPTHLQGCAHGNGVVPSQAALGPRGAIGALLHQACQHLLPWQPHDRMSTSENPETLLYSSLKIKFKKTPPLFQKIT